MCAQSSIKSEPKNTTIASARKITKYKIKQFNKLKASGELTNWIFSFRSGLIVSICFHLRRQQKPNKQKQNSRLNREKPFEQTQNDNNNNHYKHTPATLIRICRLQETPETGATEKKINNNNNKKQQQNTLLNVEYIHRTKYVIFLLWI